MHLLIHRVSATSPPMHIWWLASLPHPSPQTNVPGVLLLHLPLSPYSCSSALSQMPRISLLPVPHVFWMICLVIVANDHCIFIDLHKTLFSWLWHWPFIFFFISYQEIWDLSFWGVEIRESGLWRDGFRCSPAFSCISCTWMAGL